MPIGNLRDANIICFKCYFSENNSNKNCQDCHGCGFIYNIKRDHEKKEKIN